MATDNPKVSAYIPQHIFDPFKTFYKERQLSMSQAVGVIFAEYFGVDRQANQTGSSIGGVTLARLEALEEQIRNLAPTLESLPSDSPSRLQKLESTIVQIESRLASLEANQGSELSSKLESELPEIVQRQDNSTKQLNILDATEAFDGDPVEVVDQHQGNELNTIDADFEPISSNNLSQLRFGGSKSWVSQIKAKKSIPEFIDWTRQRDPDGIGWEPVGEPLKGYIPADELSSELKSKLLTWIKENISEKTTK